MATEASARNNAAEGDQQEWSCGCLARSRGDSFSKALAPTKPAPAGAAAGTTPAMKSSKSASVSEAPTTSPAASLNDTEDEFFSDTESSLSVPMTPALSQQETSVLAEMVKRFPKAPTNELLRFTRARKLVLEDAVAMYENHLAWRAGAGSPAVLDEAFKALPPKYARLIGVARDGSPLIFLEGGRYTDEIDPQTYVAGLAAFVDLHFPRDSLTKATVLVDVRPGQGWPNIPAAKMLPYFKLASSCLADNFPERVNRIVVYPMPWIVQALWAMIRGFLDPVTRDKFMVLSGDASLDAPCPKELGDYVARNQIPADAQARHSTFE
mmetsp:Transcript_23650/g.50477  ORF Transcript_23650/g.50477 Transcript_23650/m.50477 type:complete len:324 (+) Transcript_23650:185-1156(+)